MCVCVCVCVYIYIYIYVQFKLSRVVGRLFVRRSVAKMCFGVAFIEL